MSSSRISRRAFLIGLASAVVTVAGCSLRNQARRIKDTIKDQLKPTVKITDLNALDANDPFDVCIIGSGPAGAVLGKDLVDQGLRTIILESGPNLTGDSVDDRIKNLEMFRSSGAIDYPIASSRVRAIGGTSNIWTGRCARLHPVDFEKNAYTSEDAPWPITYADLAPYYDRAEETLRVRGNKLSKYHAPRNEDLPLQGHSDLTPLQTLMDRVGITIDDSPTSIGMWNEAGPIRVATDVLPTFTASPSATLISGVTATRLISDPTGQITSVEIQNLDREVKEVRAKVYVVACGALETARLLLLSKSDAFPNGIGNGHDQVGRYFTEHPSMILKGVIPNLESPPFGLFGRSHQFYDQFKQEGFGSIILIFYWYPENPEILTIAANLEMRPSPENRVTLASDLEDHFGNPALDLSLSFSDDDIKTIEHTRSLIHGVFNDLDARDITEEDIGWSHHHIGTCRMGDSPEKSVVDRNLRVHESPNLYVLGSSVFVTGGASHPTVAITALAHRLGEHLTTVTKEGTVEMDRVPESEPHIMAAI